MNSHFSISTQRLHIKPLSAADDAFIFELLNTAGWIEFIGNRNIHSLPDAAAYIEKVLGNHQLVYWSVSLMDENKTIGVVTFIKRDYLDFHDIGFAFLPQFSEKGYAYEATKAVLQQLQLEQKLTRILATTIPGNTRSIGLLTKLGLVFEKEIEVEDLKLHVYGATLAE